jgi:hypothetical protein
LAEFKEGFGLGIITAKVSSCHDSALIGKLKNSYIQTISGISTTN